MFALRASISRRQPESRPKATADPVTNSRYAACDRPSGQSRRHPRQGPAAFSSHHPHPGRRRPPVNLKMPRKCHCSPARRSSGVYRQQDQQPLTCRSQVPPGEVAAALPRLPLVQRQQPAQPAVGCPISRVDCVRRLTSLRLTLCIVFRLMTGEHLGNSGIQDEPLPLHSDKC